MIDDKRGFIFVENPKTATYSIKKALMGENNIHNPFDPRMATVNHCIPEIIKQKHPKKWCNYLSFVVIRNTWDRAHSFFHLYRDIADSKSYQSTNFNEWVTYGCPPPKEAHLRASMHAEGRIDDVLSQLRYTFEVDEIIVLQSYNSQFRHLELQRGINRICSLININPIQVPTNGNNYGRTDRRISWKKETIERLQIKYNKEIERFGFKKPVPS